MRPVVKFDGQPDTVQRMRAMFSRVPPQPTWKERWLLRWRIWMGEGLAIILLPLVVGVIASALLVLWLIED